jgi:hypothetical protein
MDNTIDESTNARSYLTTVIKPVISWSVKYRTKNYRSQLIIYLSGLLDNY